MVEDGVGTERRRVRFSRATSRLHRVIVIGHSGVITLDAFQWLHDTGVGFVHLGHDGDLILTAGPMGVAHQELLRAQAVGGVNGIGIDLARSLIRDKLDGQVDTLRLLPDARTARTKIVEIRRALDAATTIEDVRFAEASAARAYWDVWESVPVGFAKRDAKRVPEHWLRFGARHSPLTASPRTAANPANAMLNYLYAVLEAEARLAALVLGCDPALGILHADQRWRNSFACDLMEPVRPAVDAFLLNVLRSRSFGSGDFFENHQGVCRLLPPLTHRLAETANRWSRLVAPVAEQMSRQLMGNVRTRRYPRSATERLPTPLTQQNRSAGRQTLSATGRTREASSHNSPGDETTRKRRRRVTEQHAARRDWAWVHGGSGKADPRRFEREILPRLQRFTLSQLAGATGLSRAYCALIRRGERVPHPRHWEALRRVRGDALGCNHDARLPKHREVTAPFCPEKRRAH